MSLFQFKVKYSDDKDMTLIVELKSDQTFEDFHNAIQNAIKFNGKELASFYTCDEDWNKEIEITLLDMCDEEIKIPIMKTTPLNEYINHSGQKLIYVFDFTALWTFHIEVINIKPKPQPKTKYPLIVKLTGKIPKQNEKKIKKTVEEEMLVDGNVSLDDDPEFEPLPGDTDFDMKFPPFELDDTDNTDTEDNY